MDDRTLKRIQNDPNYINACERAQLVRLDARDHDARFSTTAISPSSPSRQRRSRSEGHGQHHDRDLSRRRPDPRLHPPDRHLRHARQFALRRTHPGDRPGLDRRRPQVKLPSRLPALAAPLTSLSSAPRLAAGPIEAGTQAGDQLERDRHLRRLRPADARHHLLGGAAHPHRQGLLRGRRRRHRLPERPGDRRRLHVGGFVPRHHRAVLHLRLLRPDLFDRLPRRLADHHVPDGRAAAQPRPLHFRRRRLLSPSAQRRFAPWRRRARWSPSPST